MVWLAELTSTLPPDILSVGAVVMKAASKFVLAAFATFVGGWTAFEFERRHRETRERRQRLAAGRRAQLVLLEQFTFLRNVDEQLLGAWRGRDDAWCSMPPAGHFNVPGTLDLAELEFLLDGSDPNVLQAVALSESSVLSVVALLQERSAWFIRLQDALAAAERERVELPTEEAFFNHAGRHVVNKVRELTIGLYRNYDTAMKRNPVVFTRLRAALREQLPGMKLLSVEGLGPATPLREVDES